MPPPYPHGQLAINDAIAERIEGFMSTIRARPAREWQLEMLMFPTEAFLSQNVFDNQGWEARVSVNVTSLPSLMKSGFHVTERNVRRRRSHFVLDPQDEDPFEDPPCHIRSYSLKSTGGPGWKAKVIVMASTVHELSQFQMPLGLSAENIGAAVGFDRSGKRVYNFSVVNSDENFNAIYDDMPLDGWWPWPQRAVHSPKKGCGMGKVFERMRKGWDKMW